MRRQSVFERRASIGGMVLAVVIAGLWLAVNAPARGEMESDLVPRAGSYTVSFGGALFDGDIDGFDLDTSYGGSLAIDYFISRAYALQLSFTALPEGLEVTALPEGLEELADVYTVGVGVKVYPLQFGQGSDFRVQPFVSAGIEGVLFDEKIRGVSIDPAAAGRVGGGADILLSRQWDLVLSAEYYHTFTRARLKVSGLGSADFELKGLLAKAGLRYKF
jgi:opacity protein-like surface antigen